MTASLNNPRKRRVVWVRLKPKMAAFEDLTRMSEVCFDVVAVLPAGGCGTRMNMDLPKQVSRPENLLRASI